MLPLSAGLLTVIPLATNTGLTIAMILGVSVAVVVCAAIPLTTGVARGHPALGIVGALVCVPPAALLGCLGGLPVACVFALVISLIPVPNKPLLTQAEIEDEVRKLRGY